MHAKALEKECSGESHRHCFPRFNLAGKIILDIGCGNGKDLLQPEFAHAAERHGIDPQGFAIDQGRHHYPQLKLECGTAERLPYPDAFFDVVMSRVTLPYTDLPRALAEIRRVLRPGGMVFFTMHDWRHQWAFLTNAVQTCSWKRVLDHAYILVASLAYLGSGKPLARPWNGRYETFQTSARFRQSMQRAGFDEVLMGRTKRHFIVQAIG